jgi:serine/threonine-protein kinase
LANSCHARIPDARARNNKLRAIGDEFCRVSRERMRPQAGDLINGKYRLVRLIGDGGMGSVFEARHEYLGTTVALKFLHPELARRPGLVERFLREARLSASIKNPHILHVTDVDQASDGAAYLVMELLEGQSLMSVLEGGKTLSLDLALDYTLQMLAGLEAAHAAGAVHRDLKPDNVFVVATPRGPFVKLLDFGIAKLRTSKEFQVALTRPGVMMGTPEYMAPEQAFSADTVDARADVYSVGAMLYEMLAGARAAQGEDAQQIAAFTIAGNVKPLNQANTTVPEGLAKIVHRAMAPSATERFGSATELRDALVPYCGSLSLAGRLAATPSSGGGVAPTWPPDEPGVAQATQAAQTTEPRRDPLSPAQAGAWPPTPQAPAPPAPQAPGPSPAYASPAYASPAYASPAYPSPAYPSPAYAPAYAQGPARIDAMPTSPTRARSPRRLSVWLLVGMVVMAIGIVVVVMVMDTVPEHRETASQARTAAPQPSPAVPTATARATTAPNATAIAPPVQPPKETVAPAANRPATKPQRTADASTEDAALPSGLPGLPLPFPLPSALPIPSVAIPLPSTLPLPIPLPSAFPPFGLPGFPQPAPAGSP